MVEQGRRSREQHVELRRGAASQAWKAELSKSGLGWMGADGNATSGAEGRLGAGKAQSGRARTRKAGGDRLVGAWVSGPGGLVEGVWEWPASCGRRGNASNGHERCGMPRQAGFGCVQCRRFGPGTAWQARHCSTWNGPVEWGRLVGGRTFGVGSVLAGKDKLGQFGTVRISAAGQATNGRRGDSRFGGVRQARYCV